jgi:quercetin dioxygenase-like cupin family protein
VGAPALGEWVVAKRGALVSRWEDELVDAFVAELGEVDGPGVDALITAWSDGLGALSPRLELRERLLRSAPSEGRYERFVAQVAALMDLDARGAAALLDGIDRPSSWVPGPLPDVSLYHVQGGPRVADAITGFVRLPQNAVFPEHRHLGDEAVLVVQGSFVDGVTGAIHRPGDVVHMPAGSAHDFRARPGPALVYLVVVRDGVQIGDVVMRADDPRM